MDMGIDLSLINKAADQVGGYSPGGKGFPYKGTAIDQRDFDKWAGAHKAEVQKILDQVIDGYKLQVTGHTDNVGPREADAAT
ncbi:MAG: hypothetical protein HY042_11245, partial [Spirochaetia bacterium]|nr:hypothetical protein [Spirochaetia bacterium]